MNMDFIGFTYNGKHSWYDLGIYRTSDGSRYNDNLTPSLNDKATDIPGGDGQYYFYTRAKNKVFSISYAFDSLTEQGLRQLKQTFNGKGIYSLIFDEAPYKTWSAKVTGNSQIKHLCFTDSQGNRVYKGEGSIQFTCYWPYARSSEILPREGLVSIAIPNRTSVECNLFTQAGEDYQLINNLGVTTTFYYAEYNYGSWSKSMSISLAPKASITFSRPTWITRLVPSATVAENAYITIAGDNYYYTSNKVFEYLGVCDGRNINHYSPALYTNKREWAPNAGFFSTPKHGENYGDIPASFVYTNSGDFAEKTDIKLNGVGQITIEEACSNIRWDSRVGLITGIVDGVERPVAYSGNALLEIPVGDNTISITSPMGGELKYNYWYY